jgi:uncharacterized protein YdeI (YjbR/CyaY-like superfamily)
MIHQGLPVLHLADQSEWESWLAEHHADCAALWLAIAKKDSGQVSVTYQQAVETALCHGWIDGQKAALDERHWLQRFTPRSPRSRWSEINRTKAEELIGQGQMQPAGMRQIEAAEADGRWAAAYRGQRTMPVPEDLSQALARRPQALAFFQALDSANRYAILYRLNEAKLPATRARRMQKYLEMLEAGEKIHA